MQLFLRDDQRRHRSPKRLMQSQKGCQLVGDRRCSGAAKNEGSRTKKRLLTLKATPRRSADASGLFIDLICGKFSRRALVRMCSNCLAKLKAFSGRSSRECFQTDLSRVGEPVYP